MFPNRHYTVEETAVGELLGVDGERDDRSDRQYRFGPTSTARIDIPGVMWISVRDGEIMRRSTAGTP